MTENIRLRPSSKRLLKQRGYIYATDRLIDLSKAKMTRAYQEANK